jgi:small subunit ribosomal protein S6
MDDRSEVLAENVYEGMFILDSNRYARDPAGVPRKIDDLIKKLGGEVLVSRLWSEQKLAYPIHGHSKGTYWLTYFRIDSGAIAELNHQTKLNENVLRSLVLLIDPRLVDTMVAHASGGVVSPTEDTAQKPPREESGGGEAEEAATAESNRSG